MLARGRLTRLPLLSYKKSPAATFSSSALKRMPSAISIHPVDPSSPSTQETARLWSTVPTGDKLASVGTTHIFFGENKTVTALSSLGDAFEKKIGNVKREIVRKTIGSSVKTVKGLGKGVEGSEVTVDASLDAHATAVAAHLSLYDFTLKTKAPSPFNPNNISPVPEKLKLKPSMDSKEWKEGVIYAESQNLARTLMELPANIITPTEFSERVKKELQGVPNVEVIVRDEAWAAEKGMRTFLSVTKGTSEPAKFLEIHYKGASNSAEPPLVFVGKGITFDSGGISLKPGAGMKLMRGDMGGAATVVSAAIGIAKLGVPINLVVLTPLCENLPGPSANKPGDVIYAMNGKSVEIDNTDAEGRLILSDALYYASTEFKPRTLIDVATLTGAMDIALGEIYSGVFTNSDDLWSELQQAGLEEHDRFWRMPLDEDYAPQISGSNADLCNTGGRPAGSCTAALFLKSFVEGVESSDSESEPTVRWAHLDIAGTMEATRPTPYQEKGMTGRPTRALIQFARSLAKES
ncbi:leucine aminopeptidase [Abortiporus biennis]|nr:leucine aminopeptidase [Abortiporus biennis]